MISSGRVTVGSQNGGKAVLGQRVGLADQVFVDGGLIENEVRHVTILLNKPMGYLCSRRSQGGDPTVYDVLPVKYQGLKTAGRLDRDSSGLVLMTSDGDLAQRLTHPRYAKNKVYEVELDKPLEPRDQEVICGVGVELPDGKSRFQLEEIDEKSPNDFSASVVPSKRSDPGDIPMLLRSGDPVARSAPLSGKTGNDTEKCLADFSRRCWRVVMSEGRNRQIRRTFGALGYSVTKLHRTVFGPYGLDGLPSGKYREIAVK